MSTGDYLIVKQGRRTILGVGQVRSEYRFDEGRSESARPRCRMAEDRRLGSSRLQDLFGHVLADSVSRLLARGLDRDYVAVRAEIPGVRGKSDLGVTTKRALRPRGKTYCEFDELQHDVLQNRIINRTLRSLLRAQLDERVRSRLRRLYRKMDTVADVEITVRDFEWFDFTEIIARTTSLCGCAD